VVTRSRAELTSVEIGVVSVSPRGRQANRVIPGGATHDDLTAIAFRAPGAEKPLAVLAVFGAHATVVGGNPARLSADYPGALVDRLRELTGARMVLFAAGAVGDASPVRPQAAGDAASARRLGELLAGDLAPGIAGLRYDAEVVLENARVEIQLPPARLTVARDWRVSPLVSYWIARRDTHLHALRIGPAVLVGMPGDYSGHLATRLAQAATSRGLHLVATSFNGDYEGYFTSHEGYENYGRYETRMMNFHGAYAGDYVTDLAGVMIERL
jgi:hypothetical protein